MINGVKVSSLLEYGHGPYGFLEAAQSAVWQSNTLTQAGAAQTLSPNQAIENFTAREIW